MTIYIGADHRGFDLKQRLIPFLQSKKVAITDCTPEFEAENDYPPIAREVSQHILDNPKERGILICGSGYGMDMAANRLKGIRAAVCRSEKDAQLARSDDFCNILVLGADFTSFPAAKRIIDAWLNTPPSRLARYLRRVQDLDTV